MTKTTSLYLDIARTLAALAVFMLHCSAQNVTGGFLWQLGIFCNDAVMAFFVLSGYVIAFCAERKHDDFHDYMIARLARLWSVVLPAMILTAVIDYIQWIATDSHIVSSVVYSIESYILSGLFFNQIWFLQIVPGSNVPFWSIGYEFVYYILFASVYYMPRATRWPVAALIVAAAGPKIGLFLPTWLLGVLAYQLSKRTFPQGLGWALWGGSLFCLGIYYKVCAACVLTAQSQGQFLQNGVFSNGDLFTKYIFLY